MGTGKIPGEHERMLACARLALGKMQVLGQSCDPRSYAAWFTYATNANPSQNAAVDQKIFLDGSISPDELEKVYGYAPASVIVEGAGNVAEGMADHAGHVMAMIEAAIEANTAFREDLKKAAHQLATGGDRQKLRTAVAHLVRASKALETRNEQLVTHLRAARQQIARLHEQAESIRMGELADRLTSLADRKAFEGKLAGCVATAELTRDSLCLLVFDVDHLDKINHAYGHMAGDHVLRVIAHALKQHTQANAFVARIGCDEFAVILPDTTLRTAFAAAEHIRCRVMATHLVKRSTGESIGSVTLSGGIARHLPGESPWTLMRRADACLEAAKRHGRNRSICDTEGVETRTRS